MSGGDEPLVLRILLDENIPRAIGPWLRGFRPEWGVVHTSEVGLNGESDVTVFQWAQDRAFVAMTFHEDFTDYRGIASTNHHGINRLRVWPTTEAEITRALRGLFESAEVREIPGAVIIVGQNTIRIRSPRRPS